jgi:hypothetical protein
MDNIGWRAAFSLFIAYQPRLIYLIYVLIVITWHLHIYMNKSVEKDQKSDDERCKLTARHKAGWKTGKTLKTRIEVIVYENTSG